MAATPDGVVVVVVESGVVVVVVESGVVVVVVVVVVPAAWTVSVKDCVAAVPIPLAAVRVSGKVPVTVGVPLSTPPTKVTPVGRAPDSVMVGVGVPDATGVNVPAEPR